MEYLLLKFAHLIAFVYWLGGDLGTFVSSNYVVNRELGTEARSTALKIMLACDQGPKLAMPVILALGIQLAATGGLMTLPEWVLVCTWLVTAYWFSVVMILYLKEGTAFAQRLASIDLYFRIAVVVVLVVSASWGLIQDQVFAADWLGWKLLVFAAMVACGICIRLALKPFIPAFMQMMQNGASEDTDQVMQASLSRARVFVFGIWAGLFLNAAIGLHLL